MARIELSAYIEGLREELQQCMVLSAGQDLRFGTEKLELEIEVAIETEVSGKGDVKFKFLVFDASVDAKADSSISRTQTLKMSLIPVYKGRTGPLMISGEISAQPES